MTDVKCGECGATNPPNRCSGCRLVWYCGRLCQKKHWKAHKCEFHHKISVAPMRLDMSKYTFTETTDQESILLRKCTNVERLPGDMCTTKYTQKQHIEKVSFCGGYVDHSRVDVSGIPGTHVSQSHIESDSALERTLRAPICPYRIVHPAPGPTEDAVFAVL